MAMLNNQRVNTIFYLKSHDSQGPGKALATVSVPSDAESSFCSSATTLGWEKLRWIGAVKQPYYGCKHVCVYIYVYI